MCGNWRGRVDCFGLLLFKFSSKIMIHSGTFFLNSCDILVIDTSSKNPFRSIFYILGQLITLSSILLQAVKVPFQV